jgi:predicted nucleic acid-binding protein
MTQIVLLDAGPLGLLTRSPRIPEAAACYTWLRTRLASGSRVLLPEIADYEVRRELLRLKARSALHRLDALHDETIYLPLTTPVMRRAAELWAQMRQQGTPTADPQALDGDVILAAQALAVPEPGDTAIVATTNVGHLGRLVPAARWQDIIED